MVKVVKTPGMDIQVPKGSAFSYKTEPALPKAHMVTIAVGKRGAGKSVAVTSLIKRLKYDRLFVISPTFNSNSVLMNQFNNVDQNDVFEDPDDLTIVDTIQERINAERDELVLYHEQLKQYKRLLKLMGDNISRIPDELLLQFYSNGSFQPPTHRYGGRNPFCAVLIDDCQSSKLFTHKKILNLTIKHRHLGAFPDDRPSIGASLFFLIQNYRSSGGGSLPRTIRNNCTNALIFKSKDEKELEHIAAEMSGEIEKHLFMEAYEYATEKDGPHGFLFIDLHKKDEHPSIFRSRFDKFLCI